jgi:hypothetical protein
MQLGFAHRALQTEQQAIIEVRRVVHPVLVQDQRVGQRTDFQKAVPVSRIARQTRHFQTHDDSGPPHTDLADQLLETFAIDRTRARLPEIGIDDDDLIETPPQRHGPLTQSILALGTLGILQDLAQRRLAHVEIGVSLQVSCLHFRVCLTHHGRLSLAVASVMLATR